MNSPERCSERDAITAVGGNLPRNTVRVAGSSKTSSVFPLTIPGIRKQAGLHPDDVNLSQAIDDLNHVFRQFGLEIHLLARDGMLEAQRPGMQSLSR